MEAFDQVMMDELLELGFQHDEEFPPLVEDVPGTSRRPVNGFVGDQRVDLSWDRAMEAFRFAGTTPIRGIPGVTHDYALDGRDLGEELPAHSVWISSAVLLSLVRALEAGSYNAAPSELRQGTGLQVESLDATMEVVTFQGERPPRQKRGRGQRRRRRR
jgi:hypothetical protein